MTWGGNILAQPIGTRFTLTVASRYVANRLNFWHCLVLFWVLQKATLLHSQPRLLTLMNYYKNWFSVVSSDGIYSRLHPFCWRSTKRWLLLNCPPPPFFLKFILHKLACNWLCCLKNKSPPSLLMLADHSALSRMACPTGHRFCLAPLHATIPEETAKKKKQTDNNKKRKEDCPLQWPSPSLSGVFPALALIQIE